MSLSPSFLYERVFAIKIFSFVYLYLRLCIRTLHFCIDLFLCLDVYLCIDMYLCLHTHQPGGSPIRITLSLDGVLPCPEHRTRSTALYLYQNLFRLHLFLNFLISIFILYCCPEHPIYGSISPRWGNGQNVAFFIFLELCCDQTV